LGREIQRFTDVSANNILSVEIGLKGGKGGYGSLLRSMKPKAKAD